MLKPLFSSFSSLPPLSNMRSRREEKEEGRVGLRRQSIRGDSEAAEGGGIRAKWTRRSGKERKEEECGLAAPEVGKE